jgi:oligopeptide transport system ATP-binding protein
MGMAIIWITHDLGVIAELADRVAVMYAGYIVEEAEIFELYQNPRHPYTLALLNSLPSVDKRRANERLATIPGSPPDGIAVFQGCPLAPRCRFRIERCLQVNPKLETIGLNHKIACWVDVNTGRQI